MSNTSLQKIVNSNTFGVWIERTNDLVDEIATVVQIGGNSTDNADGSVYINGDIISTANSVVDVIKPFDTSLGANKVTIDSETVLNGDSFIDGVLSVANQGSGNSAISFVNNATQSWKIETNHSNSLIISSADEQAQLIINNTTDTITSTGLTIDADILPDSATFTGGVTANLTGDVKNSDGTIVLDVGSNSVAATFKGTANNANYVGSLQNSSGINQFDTDDINEGTTNKFYSDNLARGAFSKGTGISISSAGVISIGQAVGSSDNVTFNSVSVAEVRGGNSRIDIQNNSLQLKPNDVTMVNVGTTGGTIYGAWSVEDRTGAAAALDVKGAIRADSDITAFYNFSDIKLKENIEPIENALSKVDALNGYTFNYKNKPDTRVAGVIAQELIQVLPEAVYEVVDGDETNMAVRYDNIIALLIEAVKDLKAEVEDLKQSRS